ncbi:PPE family protein, partial [Mycolicibacillus trivialis]
MLDPRWLGPPEIIAATFEVGPGPAATVANQVVWLTEAVNHEVMMGVSAANTAATSTQWIGLGGAASATAAAGLNAGLQTMIGWITHKIAVTQAAVEAYAVAASTVVPSAVCQANRDEWSVLNATNLLGFNTPAIVALDTEYFGEHYPHNSGIATVYAGVLSALTAALALPPPPALPTAAPAAPAAAGQA